MLGVILLCSAIVAAHGGVEEPKISAASVSQLTVSVSNLTASIQFYTQVLGGMYAESISRLEPTSNVEYVNMFLSTDEKGLPDAKCEGSDDLNSRCTKSSSRYQVSWAYIIFDNTMVQLLQVGNLNPSTEESTQDTKPRPQNPMMSSKPKIAFWVMDDVNFGDYLDDVKDQAARLGFEKVKIVQPALLSETACERDANVGVRQLRDNKLAGLSIAYASGPDGENLKFIQMINSSRIEFGKHYCTSRAVNSALMDHSYVDRCGDHKTGLASKLYGVNHISIMTMDINKTLDLYVDQLGGHLIDDIQPSHLQSPSLSKLIPGLGADQSAESKLYKPESADKNDKLHKTMKIPGVVGGPELNLRYVLLSNIKIEIAYMTGIDFMKKAMGGAMSGPLKSLMKPTYDFTQPGEIKVHFHFPSRLELDGFIDNTQSKGPENDVNGIEAIYDGELAGLEHATVTGLKTGRLDLVHYTGTHRRNVHRHLKQYGAVSSLYYDLNPFTYNGYGEFCDQYVQDHDEL